MKQWEYINKSPTGYTLALVGSSILIKHEKSLPSVLVAMY